MAEPPSSSPLVSALVLAAAPLTLGYSLGWLGPGAVGGVAVLALLFLAGVCGIAGWVRGAVRPVAEGRPILGSLITLIEDLAAAERPERLDELPTGDPGEAGRLARAVRELCVNRIRHHHDAKRLRRTLDHEVGHATRRATADLQRLAHGDPLTGLGNRRAMDERLPGLLARAEASGRDVACLLIDMDHFKRVNDTLGHAAGDELIRLLADLIGSLTRDGDLAVRLGGDEFVLFLPGADPERAERLAEQLRGLFRQQTRGRFDAEPRPSLSAGLASRRLDDAADGPALLEVADRRLYEAKRRGRGRTVGR